MSPCLERPLGEPRTMPIFESPRPPENAPAEKPAADSVCEVCNSVDWPLIANLKHVSRQMNPWCVMIPLLDSTSAELSASPCKVCRLLAVIKPSTYDGQQCALYAYKGSYNYTQLRVIPHGLETRHLHRFLEQEIFPSLTLIGSSDDQDLKGMKVQPDRIDPECYENLRSVMRNCVRNHGQTCRPVSKFSRIPGLKVIEVSSGKVVEAPEKCEYIALSYVWGNHQHSDDPRAAPPVIKDTFSVAENLGLEYIWIDKYASTIVSHETS